MPKGRRPLPPAERARRRLAATRKAAAKWYRRNRDHQAARRSAVREIAKRLSPKPQGFDRIWGEAQIHNRDLQGAKAMIAKLIAKGTPLRCLAMIPGEHRHHWKPCQKNGRAPLGLCAEHEQQISGILLGIDANVPTTKLLELLEIERQTDALLQANRSRAHRFAEIDRIAKSTQCENSSK